MMKEREERKTPTRSTARRGSADMGGEIIHGYNGCSTGGAEPLVSTMSGANCDKSARHAGA